MKIFGTIGCGMEIIRVWSEKDVYPLSAYSLLIHFFIEISVSGHRKNSRPWGIPPSFPSCRNIIILSISVASYLSIDKFKLENIIKKSAQIYILLSNHCRSDIMVIAQFRLFIRIVISFTFPCINSHMPLQSDTILGLPKNCHFINSHFLINTHKINS